MDQELLPGDMAGSVGAAEVLLSLIRYGGRSGRASPDGMRELMARHGLTPREAEVTVLLALGASDREVARRLGISPHTARKHAEHIFSKLDIHSRKALALRLGQPAAGAGTSVRHRGGSAPGSG